MPPARNGGFSFVGMVVGVMTLLKIKDKYDQCVSLYFFYTPQTELTITDKQTSSEDEEGRVALNSPSVENLSGGGGGGGGIALLDTEIPVSMRRPKKKGGCCMCCGIE